MFRKLAQSIVMVATLATGATAMTAAPAAAESVRFGVTIGNAHAQPVRHLRHHRRTAVACTPRHALRKAGRLGVHRAHIRLANRRVIVVAGRSRHHRSAVRFARAPGCPVISYRR